MIWGDAMVSTTIRPRFSGSHDRYRRHDRNDRQSKIPPLAVVKQIPHPIYTPIPWRDLDFRTADFPSHSTNYCQPVA